MKINEIKKWFDNYYGYDISTKGNDKFEPRSFFVNIAYCYSDDAFNTENLSDLLGYKNRSVINNCRMSFYGYMKYDKDFRLRYLKLESAFIKENKIEFTEDNQTLKNVSGELLKQIEKNTKLKRTIKKKTEQIKDLQERFLKLKTTINLN